MKGNIGRIIYLIFFVLFISACAGVHPLSNYARTGDTVMIALGGEHIRTNVAVLKKENISVTISDSGLNTYPVKMRHLFKVTADLASDMNYSGLYSGSFAYGQGAYQGQWLAIIDLIDPVTEALPSLTTGSAVLTVTGEGVISSPASQGNGNISAIPIEILPGQGTPNPLNSFLFLGDESHPTEMLEPLPQIDISPSPFESNFFGGASLVLKYVDTDFASARPPRAVPATQDPNVQVFSVYESQGDGTTLLKIYIMNPRGFLPVNDHTGLHAGASDLHSLSVRIVWSQHNTIITDSNWQDSFPIMSGEYIDINGEVIAGITPIYTKVR